VNITSGGSTGSGSRGIATGQATGDAGGAFIVAVSGDDSGTAGAAVAMPASGTSVLSKQDGTVRVTAVAGNWGLGWVGGDVITVGGVGAIAVPYF
jgi:hypothetical protein